MHMQASTNMTIDARFAGKHEYGSMNMQQRMHMLAGRHGYHNRSTYIIICCAGTTSCNIIYMYTLYTVLVQVQFYST